MKFLESKTRVVDYHAMGSKENYIWARFALLWEGLFRCLNRIK